MYNKAIVRFGFCDIQNNRGLGKGYLPRPSAFADNPYLNLDYSTLGSRGYFFLIDTIQTVRGEAGLTRKKITSGHRSTQPHFHVRSQFRI